MLNRHNQREGLKKIVANYPLLISFGIGIWIDIGVGIRVVIGVRIVIMIRMRIGMVINRPVVVRRC